MSYIKDDVSAKRKIGMVLTYAVLILFTILAGLEGVDGKPQ